MLKNRNGSALVIVLIVFLVLTILGSAVLALSVSENKQVAILEKKMKSYYVARAGADAMASYLIEPRKDPVTSETVNPGFLVDTFIEKTKSGPAIGEIDGRKFEIYVTGTQHEFIIESKAYTPEGIEDSNIFLTMKEFNLLDYGIFTHGKLDVGNNLTVNNNIGTNEKSIIYGNKTVNGNITLGVNATSTDISDAEKKAPGYIVDSLPTPMNLPVPNEADFPISIEDNTVDINTANYSTQMVDGALKASLNKIELKGGVKSFYVHGGGQVHLFIKDYILVSGNREITTDEKTELYIYYDKDDKIEFSGSTSTTNVTLYAPNATVQFNGGGSETHKGSIICHTFNGPSSNVVLNKGSGSMKDLNIKGVSGYFRAIWSN